MLLARALRNEARLFTASRAARSFGASPVKELIEQAAASAAAEKKGARGGKQQHHDNLPILPYQAIIPRTNVKLEDPTLPAEMPRRRPYPVPNAMTTTGKPAEYIIMPAFVRTDFTSGNGLFIRDKMGMVPISVLGSVPGRPGHNPLQLVVDKRDLVRELKAPGVYTRMVKFDLQPMPGSDIDISAIKKAEEHTIGLLRTIDMNPMDHTPVSAVYKRYVPGRWTPVKVPVQFINANVCAGLKKGGVLLYVRHSLPCLFKGDALPNYNDISIKIDLQNLDINSRIRLTDIQLGPGLRPAKPDADVIFVSCKKIIAELGAKAEEEA